MKLTASFSHLCHSQAPEKEFSEIFKFDSVTVSILFGVWGPTPDSAQELLLALSWRVTSKGAQAVRGGIIYGARILTGVNRMQGK